jgi:hypothetical protein
MLVAGLACQQPAPQPEDPVAVYFDRGYGQLEVGGPYVGLEFHDSRPLPSRVSFYAPVANSLDLSTDYWKRGESRPVVMGIRVDARPRTWLGKRPWGYRLSPHSARFFATEGDLRLTLAYDFCLNEPAAVMSLTMYNAGSSAHTAEVYTHTAIVLRSCQTYTRFDSARTRSTGDGIVASFDEGALGGASVSVQNAGMQPASWTSDASALALSDTGWSNWIDGGGELAGTLSPAGGRVRAAAAFMYRVALQPGDSATITQLLSSTGREEIDRTMERLRATWREEVARYDSAVRSAVDRGLFRSGDAWTDRAVSYSKALLESNQHFLDGAIVPMPCPAEYNFMFTHDILLTNLSAIVFDPQRVRRDLLHLLALSRDSVLSHAYYWKDDAFITEYCAPGNWNHLWFVLATASYLRHTSDTATVTKLMPVVSQGIVLTLTRRRGNLMMGNEPDWWDFGHAEGTRAYLTILTIRALEEYQYLGSVLGMKASTLRAYEQVAADLRTGLRDELWDDAAGYLYNTTGGLRDRHVYMGPLLAAAYGTLPPDLARRLVGTARRELLDPAIGVRTVAPADFHTDSVKKFYNVKGNEAGGPYLYANGGVWYLGNAWYAWALRAVGELDSAFAFYRRTMTVDGITQSPRGQPALYEYRFSDTQAHDHGWVDKPTMMWSAGFCIGTAYRMIGVDENAWNVSVGGGLPGALHNVEADYVCGTTKRILVSGHGSTIARILVDGVLVPSRVIPRGVSQAQSIRVEHGPVRYPYLDGVNAVLHDARLDTAGRSLSLTLSSFEGHATTVSVVSPWVPDAASLNGATIAVMDSEPGSEGVQRLTIEYPATKAVDTLIIHFGPP